MIKPFVLASQSPRRRQLLEQSQLTFEVMVKFTEEENYPDDMAQEDVPVFLARKKAQATQVYLKDAFHGRHSSELVVGADTIVIIDGEILNKPETLDNAKAMLRKLSGKTHKVITGVVILGDTETTFSEVTEVTFHELTDFQIDYYVDTFNPCDKAGAYAIQEWIGLTGIKGINGDYYNVVGLPVSRLMRELEKLNQ